MFIAWEKHVGLATDVGLATLHPDRMVEAYSEHVGLITLHLDRMGEVRFEHVSLTTHLVGKALQRFQSSPSKKPCRKPAHRTPGTIFCNTSHFGNRYLPNRAFNYRKRDLFLHDASNVFL